MPRSQRNGARCSGGWASPGRLAGWSRRSRWRCSPTRRRRRCSTTRRRASASTRPTRASRRCRSSSRTASPRSRRSCKSQGLVDLFREIELIKADIARLRGQIEVLTHELERGAEAPARPLRRPRLAGAQARGRAGGQPLPRGGRAARRVPRAARAPPSPGVRRCRRTPDRGAAARGRAAAGAARPADAAAEQRSYDAALEQFKRGDYPGAIAGFQLSCKAYPKSPLAPSAQYWVGNAQFAQKDYRAAIAAQRALIANYPDSQKVPDALLNIALGAVRARRRRAARRTLEELIAKHPQSEAAAKRAQRLRALAASARAPLTAGREAARRRSPRASIALAAQARPPRPAVAEHARPVPDLAVRDHAAADAGGDGDAVLRALPRRVSRRRRARRGAARPRARALERASATTAARTTCTPRRGRSSSDTAAPFRRMSTASPRCRASAARPRRRSPRSRSAGAPRSSTATSSACSRATAASRAFPARPRSRRRCGRCAEALLPRRDIEAYTQGLMDLGATVCTRTAAALRRAARSAADCVARRDGRVDELPSPRPAQVAAAPRAARAAARATPATLLLERRPADRHLGGAVEPARAAARRGRRRALPCALRCEVDACRSVARPDRARLHPLPADAASAARSRCAAGPRAPRRRGRSGSLPDDAIAAALPAPIRRLLREVAGTVGSARRNGARARRGTKGVA